MTFLLRPRARCKTLQIDLRVKLPEGPKRLRVQSSSADPALAAFEAAALEEKILRDAWGKYARSEDQSSAASATNSGNGPLACIDEALSGTEAEEGTRPADNPR